MIRKDSFYLLLLFVILFASFLNAEKKLVLKNTCTGVVSELPLFETKEKDIFSLSTFCRSVNVMYDYDRIFRKALLQNNNNLLQVAEGIDFISSFGEILICDMPPVVYDGSISLSVEDLPKILSQLNLSHYEWSVIDRMSEPPDDIKEIIPNDNKIQPSLSMPSITATTQRIDKSFLINDINNLKFVVIDAGHGGYDPGGIGLTGLREKTVVLKVALMVEKKIKEKMPDVEVFLTRRDNTFLSLSQRTKFANQLLKNKKHGVFISIHANISRNKNTSGFETYYLSDPTDDEARAVAAMENGVIENGNELNPVNRVLSSLLDVELIRQSSLLAMEINKGYSSFLPQTLSRGIKTARFFVLDGTMMPSVLTEIGFLSNKEEEKNLRNDLYLERIADSIVEGIINFSRQYNRTNGFT